MSSHVLSRLPRFDTALDADALSRIGVQGATPPTAPEAPADEIESEAPEPAVEPGADLAEVTAMVAALGEAVQTIEAGAREQLRAAIASLAADLFPQLSQAFLAEEIARTLEPMVPVSISALEIRSQPALAEPLREAVARIGSLAERCTVVEQEPPDAPGVEVSWQTGGLTFDFERLLADSLARLNAA